MLLVVSFLPGVYLDITSRLSLFFPSPAENDIVMVGGRKYRETLLKPRDNITPGVRRSKRVRLPPIHPLDMLNYEYHWGTTPSGKVGENPCLLAEHRLSSFAEVVAC